MIGLEQMVAGLIVGALLGWFVASWLYIRHEEKVEERKHFYKNEFKKFADIAISKAKQS